MSPVSEMDARYRRVIDRLVESCAEGYGQIGARRARSGAWSAVAEQRPSEFPFEHAMNGLLARLDADDREVIAHFLAQEYVGGVHDTLVVLHEEEMHPFDEAYEGTPFHDFVGRLDGWEWPA